MAEKSVGQKLALKSGHRLLILRAPQKVEALLGVMPQGVDWTVEESGLFERILVFVRSFAEMKREIANCAAKLAEGGAIWLAYPKGSSKLAGDINRDSIRDYVVGQGLDTVATIAIDADWSALRLKRAG